VSNFQSLFSASSLIAAPENLLNVTDNQFYDYDHFQKDVDFTKTVDGHRDAISLLYSHDEVDQYVTYPFLN